MTRGVLPWLRLFVGVGLVAVLGWRYGSGALLNTLRALDGARLLAALGAALGIGVLTTVLSAWRWCIVARGVGLALPLGRAVADYYRAVLLNAVLPAGVLGDAHRAVSHGRRSGDLGAGVRAVFLERVAGQAVLIGVGLPLVCTAPAVAGVLSSGRLMIVVPIVLLSVVLLGVVLLGAVARWGPGAARWRRAVHTLLADVRRGLLARSRWPGVLVLSVAVTAGHVAMFVVAARLAGAHQPIGRLVPLLVLALIVMGLPLSVGGWGPREAVSAFAFGTAGLGAGLGFSTAVLYGVLALVAALPGAGVLLVGRRAVRVEDRQVSRERPDQAGEQVCALAGRGQ